MLEEMNAFYNPWSVFQQPYHPSSGVNPAYRLLLAALDQGWHVQQPVQILPTNRMDTQMYRFILTHPVTKQETVINVPAIPEVDLTIKHNNYLVMQSRVI
jgi:hypothetical protein